MSALQWGLQKSTWAPLFMTNLDVDTLNLISAVPCSVNVTTSARLHMGFFDLNGGLGRKFGSIGAVSYTHLTLPTKRIV